MNKKVYCSQMARINHCFQMIMIVDIWGGDRKNILCRAGVEQKKTWRMHNNGNDNIKKKKDNTSSVLSYPDVIYGIVFRSSSNFSIEKKRRRRFEVLCIVFIRNKCVLIRQKERERNIDVYRCWLICRWYHLLIIYDIRCETYAYIRDSRVFNLFVVCFFLLVRKKTNNCIESIWLSVEREIANIAHSCCFLWWVILTSLDDDEEDENDDEEEEQVWYITIKMFWSSNSLRIFIQSMKCILWCSISDKYNHNHLRLLTPTFRWFCFMTYHHINILLDMHIHTYTYTWKFVDVLMIIHDTNIQSNLWH